ncbi:MAG: aldehyde dehydrogenase (NADP(+)) [Muricauda sp.]|nr:aldehyde dehydrogenase (NADP(+)) [Allomuricauda sp.]MBO6588496.1 aldehyde dehydrogenase (NADP(+)) [Allomuricauda sp.]MBO6618364.1 aldehyde dehydrogenase (NADP(+)) [Allomuricauda sp.]MBO6644034.1 aldehyde dehydrogenase (NADP(+)) [Allomuricauda sp.]MBO6746918.1 aldehyde dehydrogenase (NADP(+)) [Allomuricauda sp.]MBO6845049.1 aldehyde dehydrogenase (NADP(+)) [Allomuricauda sp.]
MMTGKNCIGGQFKADGSVEFRTVDPKKNVQNPTVFVEATKDEIDTAVDMAWEAFKVFRTMQGKQRADFLNTIADEMLALDQELIDTYMLESGLPEGRAIGERGRTVFQLRSFAELVANDDWRENIFDAAQPDRKPQPKPDLRKTMIPLGPVAVFGASNFPLAYSTAGGDTASALAAGCPVIVKSHPMHAGTNELVASAIVKAAEKTGMPKGVFSSINGSVQAGIDLVNHPKVKAVGFTGSIGGGRALFDLAAKREEPIPVFAEMGSINPVIMTASAISKRGSELAKTYAGSITLGTGQFCTNPGLLLTVKSEDTHSFIQELAKETVSIAPQTMLHPNIKKGYISKGDAVTGQEGVEVVATYDGNLDANEAAATIATVSGRAFLDNPKMHQEVFGPFSMVVQCEDEAELIQIIEGLEGQLTGTLIAEKNDTLNLSKLVDALQHRVGRIIYNGVPTGVEVCASMQHGGPYPASTDSRFTAVGVHSIKRWVRPISYQSFPMELLPDHLKK